MGSMVRKNESGSPVNGILDIVDGTRLRPGSLPAAIRGTGGVITNQVAIDVVTKARVDFDKEVAKPE